MQSVMNSNCRQLQQLNNSTIEVLHYNYCVQSLMRPFVLQHCHNEWGFYELIIFCLKVESLVQQMMGNGHYFLYTYCQLYMVVVTSFPDWHSDLLPDKTSNVLNAVVFICFYNVNWFFLELVKLKMGSK